MMIKKIFQLYFSFVFLLGYQVAFAQTDSAQVSELFNMPFENLLNAEVYASARYLQNADEAPSSTSVVTAEDIKNYGYQTLDQLLLAQKGLFVSNDRNYTYLGSRGFSRPSDYNNRIVLLLDGNKLNENVYGQGFIGSTLSLNMDQIARVEIIRGTGSALYGNGAMLGIINIVTKEGADVDGVHLKAAYGSYGKKQAAGMYGGTIGDEIDISVSAMGASTVGQDLYYEELDSPENNDGRSIAKDWEKQYGINLRASGEHLTLSAYHSNRSKGIPTGAWDMRLTGDNYSRDVRSFVGLEYVRHFGENQLFRSTANYNDYMYSGQYQYDGWDEHDQSTGRWITFNTEYHRELGRRHKMIVGMEYNYSFRADYSYWVEEDVHFDQNFPFSYCSLFFQDEFKISDQVTLWSGLRLDKHGEFDPALSPRISLVAKPTNKSVLKLMYGRAFRSPNVYESHVEEFTYLKTNPSISPEWINSMEVAWEQRLGSGISTSVALYHFKVTNLIDQVIDPVDDLAQYINKDFVFGFGSEIELRVATAQNSSGYLNMSVQKATQGDNNLVISNSPRLMLKAGWSMQLFDFLRVSPEMIYESSRLTVYDTWTEPFLLANINFQTGTFLKRFNAGLKIRNLLNTTYSYPGGYDFLQGSIEQDKLNFLFQLNVKI